MNFPASFAGERTVLPGTGSGQRQHDPATADSDFGRQQKRRVSIDLFQLCGVQPIRLRISSSREFRRQFQGQLMDARRDFISRYGRNDRDNTGLQCRQQRRLTV